MVTDILKTPSVQRLAGILQSRYGKDLEVRFIVDASAGSWSTAEASVSSGDLYIPINVRGTFLGLAKVPGVQSLPGTSIAAITDVVKLVLEPALYRRFLDGRVTTLLSKQNEPVKKEALSLETSSKNAKAVLLCSHNPSVTTNMAIALHEETERWAMLRYSDMDFNFTDVQTLNTIGRATIFIEDVLQIAPKQWEILKAFLLQSNSAHHPLILLGTSRSWIEWRNSGEMDHDILDMVAPYTAELDRWPTNRKQQQEAFRLLLQPSLQTKT